MARRGAPASRGGADWSSAARRGKGGRRRRGWRARDGSVHADRGGAARANCLGGARAFAAADKSPSPAAALPVAEGREGSL